MTWFLGVVVVLLLGGVVVVAAGRGAAMRPVYDDRPDPPLPISGPLTAQDLRRVRFAVGVRGYRMDEVDALLRRLAVQLDDAPPDPDPAAPPERGVPDQP
ncbi:MAG: DivIVA domain-containing protein [Actinomycetota bacterium]|nr:DivIVA domain-containing protein [Actinomycetota bacterium]MDQ3465137.1 DivIVA domain-containing protein [Actinomycetota bacterium]